MKKFFGRYGYPDLFFFPKNETPFLVFVVLAFVASMFVVQVPGIAMWLGFLFAAYAAIANDSIQTIGTFIASNQDKKWWVLWIFLGGIFCLTMFYSWHTVDETGVTLMVEKVEMDSADRNLTFYGNHTVNEYGSIETKGGKSIGGSIDIDVNTQTNTVNWSVKDTDIRGSAAYNTTYENTDYGLCFYLNADGHLCEVTNLIKESDLQPSVKNTFNKYVKIEFRNLVTNETGNQPITYESNKSSVLFTLFNNGESDGDVSNGRLAAKGFEKAPTSFHFLQIAAPIFLLILTRLRMPVSTTFILLTSFAATETAVGKVLAKSFSGYILAFFIGLIAFLLLARITKKWFVGEAKPWWTVAQWAVSGTLWSVWLMQDAANIAVYLPRSLNVGSFIAFTLVIVIGLGLLLYYRGGRIQQIVTEKSDVTDVRFATIIDLIYCILLFYFKLHSKVPMSTTWVFLGLLGGRELGMALMRTAKNNKRGAAKIIVKDFSYAMIGLVISIAIAVGVNDNLSFATMAQDIPEQFGAGIQKFFTRLFGG